MGHADQLPVGKHGAGALAAVVQDHVDARRKQIGIELLRCGFHGLTAIHAHRADDHGEGGDGVRPDDAALIVVLFDGGGRQTGDTDAVAAHLKERRLAILAQERGVHGLGVLGAKIEHVAYLDAAFDGQLAFAVGRLVAGHDVAQVGHSGGLGQVTRPVHAGDVVVHLVSAADPIRHHGHFAVGNHLHRLLQPNGAQVARLAAEMVFDLGQGGETEALVQPWHLGNLDLVHVMVAAQQQQPYLRAHDVTGIVQRIGGQHQRLHGGGQRHAKQLRHVGTGGLAGGGCLGHGLRSCRARLRGRQCLGLLHVGGVVALRAVDDGILAGCRNHLEFLAQVATNGATVGSHSTVAQAETVKNAAVSRCHHLVAGLGADHVAVKGIGVLHDELAPAHQAKARTALVAELGLNLVQILGQLLVAAQLLACDVGDHFFAGWLDHEIAVMAVLDAQQLGAHLLEAPRLLPQFRRLHHGHGALHRTRPVHLFTHDGLDLADDTQPHRHVVINSGPQLLDQPGPHHELVADHFGVRRSFLEGRNEELGGFHGWAIRLFGQVPLAGTGQHA